MTLLDRLVKRLRAEVRPDIPEGLTFQRTHAGRVQRQQGAWSWWAQDESGREVLASYQSLTELLRCRTLTLGHDLADRGMGRRTLIVDGH